MSLFYVHVDHPTYKKLGVRTRTAEWALTEAQRFVDQWMPGHTAWAARPCGDNDRPFVDYAVTRLPFEGLYESKYSQLIDSEEERWCEYEADERQEEDNVPKDQRLTGSELFDIVSRHSNYGEAFEAIARDYVECYSYCGSDALDFKHDMLGLVMEGMDSPKEYNFRTDRVYAHIHPLVLHHLFVRSQVNGHKALKVILERDFTSRPGFSSHYDNTLARWIEKDLDDWDHNEMCALVEAVVKEGDKYDEFDWSVYERVAEDSYEYWSDCVQWDKVEADIAEARANKLEELRKDDPDYVPIEPRCPVTIEMDFGRAA